MVLRPQQLRPRHTGGQSWKPYLEQLSQHFDVIAPDHPGFGLSDELPEVATMATASSTTWRCSTPSTSTGSTWSGPRSAAGSPPRSPARSPSASSGSS